MADPARHPTWRHRARPVRRIGHHHRSRTHRRLRAHWDRDGNRIPAIDPTPNRPTGRNTPRLTTPPKGPQPEKRLRALLMPHTTGPPQRPTTNNPPEDRKSVV